MNPTQRKALLDLAGRYRKTCHFVEAKAIERAIQVLVRLEKTKESAVPAKIDQTAMN